MVKRRQISSQEASVALEIIQTIPIRLVRVVVRDALSLAMEHNIYAYDAYFLQTARQLSCPLLSLDKRMNQVATALGIDILE
jgi:predicted nucleic acid-binding protein